MEDKMIPDGGTIGWYEEDKRRQDAEIEKAKIPDIEHDLEVTHRTRKHTPKGTSERAALWKLEKELERKLDTARREELEQWQNAPSPRTCLLCAHYQWDSGSSGYSEVTPGYGWSSECNKGHFAMSGPDTSTREYRGNLLRAQSCPDFELSQEAGEILRESARMDAEKAARCAIISANAPAVEAFVDDLEVVCRKHGMLLPDELYRVVRSKPSDINWPMKQLHTLSVYETE